VKLDKSFKPQGQSGPCVLRELSQVSLKGNEMPYQVKAVKTFHGHDGGCWECSLYNPKGKRIALVVEDGWGGELQFHWINGKEGTETVTLTQVDFDTKKELGKTPVERTFHIDERELDEFCKTLPQWELFDGEMTDTTPDIYLGNLVNTFLDTREVKKLLKKTTIFDGKSIITWNVPYGNENVNKQIADKYPDAIILNRLTLPEAVELYGQLANGK
jgi:hypothetical protein